MNPYYARLLKKSEYKTSKLIEESLEEPKWMKFSQKYYRIWKIYKQLWSTILNSKLNNAKSPTSTSAEINEFQTFYLRHIFKYVVSSALRASASGQTELGMGCLGRVHTLRVT